VAESHAQTQAFPLRKESVSGSSTHSPVTLPLPVCKLASTNAVEDWCGSDEASTRLQARGPDKVAINQGGPAKAPRELTRRQAATNSLARAGNYLSPRLARGHRAEARTRGHAAPRLQKGLATEAWGDSRRRELRNKWPCTSLTLLHRQGGTKEGSRHERTNLLVLLPRNPRVDASTGRKLSLPDAGNALLLLSAWKSGSSPATRRQSADARTASGNIPREQRWWPKPSSGNELPLCSNLRRLFTTVPPAWSERHNAGNELTHDSFVALADLGNGCAESPEKTFANDCTDLLGPTSSNPAKPASTSGKLLPLV